MRSRKGFELTLTALIVLILLVLVFIFVGIPAIKKLVAGSDSMFACGPPNECLPGCPDGYTPHGSGDLYCADKFKGAAAGGTKCCEPAEIAEGSVRSGDIRLSYKDRSRMLVNGETVELAMMDATTAGGIFYLDFGASARDEKCYAQLEDDNGKIVQYTPANRNFFNPPVLTNGVLTETTFGDEVNLNNNKLVPCKNIMSKQDFRLGSAYQKYLGQTLTYSIVVVPKKSCDDSGKLSSCQPYYFSVKVKVPDRKPKIAVALDGKTLASGTVGVLQPGKTSSIEVTIEEPLTICGVKNPDANLLKTAGVTLSPDTTVDNTDCIKQKRYVKNYVVTLPGDAPRSFGFALNVSTRMGTEAADRKIEAAYRFQVAPEERVRVIGPAPGLTNEKVIDIVCDKVVCHSFTAAYLPDPWKCTPNGGGLYEAIPGLTVYGNQGSNRWRFWLRNENYNEKPYVCVKAEITDADGAKKTIYTPGIWNGAPAKVTIDRMPPVIDVSYDPFKQILTFACQDAGSTAEYVSGCKERPYSYAFVTDPLKFVASVLTGGVLASTFTACPAPDATITGGTSAWISYNSDKNEMPYMSYDVRVICVRATDNAGNSVVQSKLLYSGQEALALFLTEISKKT